MHQQKGITTMTITTENATSVAELERLKVLKNGEKVTLTFSDAEFERRLAGLRRIMAEKDLDAVVLTSYHSIKYYSDFLFTYFGRSYAMVVTKDDTVTVTANIDAGMPWRRSYGDNIVYTDWRRDNFIFGIQEVLRRRLPAFGQPQQNPGSIPVRRPRGRRAGGNAPANDQVRRGDRSHQARGTHRRPGR
jgi:creatinase